jgi:hypothetical protein
MLLMRRYPAVDARSCQHHILRVLAVEPQFNSLHQIFSLETNSADLKTTRFTPADNPGLGQPGVLVHAPGLRGFRREPTAAKTSFR